MNTVEAFQSLRELRNELDRLAETQSRTCDQYQYPHECYICLKRCIKRGRDYDAMEFHRTRFRTVVREKLQELRFAINKGKFHESEYEEIRSFVRDSIVMINTKYGQD